jgi:hypothetical protein
MATVQVLGVYSYGYPFESAVLPPGGSRALTWGPADAFSVGAVVLTPHSFRNEIGQTTMRVSDLESWTIKIPIGAGGFTTNEYHVGARVTNIGSTPIPAFTVTVAVIKPGPDGH